MKKIIALAFAAFSLAACNDNEADDVTVETEDTTSVAVDTNTTVDTTITTTTTSKAYTPEEGDVIYRNKKVMVRRNGEWVETNEDVKLDNGVVVNREGKVRKDGREVELEEGEAVSKTGEFFDKTGRAIENAWDATKEGAKDAGRAVKKVAKKVGEKVENAVEPDNKE
jgi:hypothetical protein